MFNGLLRSLTGVVLQHSKGVKGVKDFARAPKPNEPIVADQGSGKKHHKGHKREKLRRVYGGGVAE